MSLQTLVSALVVFFSLSVGLAAQAQDFDAAGRPLLFRGSGTGSGTTVNSFRDYTDVITIDGTRIDARVTLVELSGATVSTFDSTTTPYSEGNFFQPLLNINSVGGYALFRFDFFVDGQPVTLRNFYANTYDLDGSSGSSSGRQFSEFSDVASYTLAQDTDIGRQLQGGGITRFVTLVGGNVDATPGSDTFNRVRARAFFTSIDDLTVKVGDAGATGTAYYGLDFSIGYAFNNAAVDDTAPVVAARQTLSYPENRSEGAVIGTVSATDDIGVTAYRFEDTATRTSSDGYYTIDNVGAVRLTAAGVAAGVANNDFETTPNSFIHIIQASDDADNWSAGVRVVFEVTDVDDAPPVITGPGDNPGATSSSVSVDEEQTAVTTFTADESVSWSITGGVDSSRFLIDASTGALTFRSAPDFENPADSGTNNVYDLVVTATDGSGNTSTQSVTVTVLDVDEIAPEITGPSGSAGSTASEISVDEEQTAVTTFSANESVTWTLTGGADASLLAIDPTTGVLTFRAAPDFEAPADAGANNVYVAVVTATDAKGNASSQTIEITILNIDDAPPVITGPSGGAGDASAAISVSEEQSQVTTLAANETVTWTISGGVDASLFSIDSATGELRFRSAPDYEDPADSGRDNVYNVIITATDAGGNDSAQSLAITVLDVDDTAPSITGPGGSGSNAKISVDEGSTSVFSFAASEPVTWSISGGVDAARFAIDSSTGALTFVTPPDFEAPTDTGTDNVYNLVVTATDASGNDTALSLAVTVLDVDDTAPSISGPSGSGGDASSAVEVDEGQASVATFSASEAVDWSITGGADAARFGIDTATGALTFRAAPDYETPTDANGDNLYELIVTATDANGNSSNQTVRVTVLDVDEVAPDIVWPGSPSGATSATISLDEGTVAVATLSANEAVTWSLTGGADAAFFAIDSATGALTFRRAADFEDPADSDRNNTYALTLTATDANGNASSFSVTVNVLDVDEIAPVIAGSGGISGPSAAVSVDEEQTAVVALSASEDVTWSIDGGADAAAFAIDPSSGRLTFAAAPDFETPTDGDGNNVYEVRVVASDASGNSSTILLAVTVLDLDEVAPQLSAPGGGSTPGSAAISVEEGIIAVTTLTANEAVTWSLATGGDAARFRIDPASGVLTFLAAPDYEAPTDSDVDNVYDLIVLAEDGSGNEGRLSVVVTVLDVDDTAPGITGPGGSAGAAASAIAVNEGQSDVSTFAASEAVTWSLTGGADVALFAIDPASSALKFLAAPDFEAPADADTDNVYEVVVTATDGNGNISRQSVAVTVLDIDDTAPVIDGDSGATLAFDVQEGETGVATLSADESVAWAITGGADAAKFEIDAATGSMVFRSAPDFEQPEDVGTDNVYELVVTATDGNDNATARTILVTVTDVDDTRPGLALAAEAEGSTLNVDEGERQIVTLSADEAVTWSLTGGADAALFSLSADGELSFLDATDYEAPADADGDNVYEIEVTATDTAGNVSTMSLRIRVLDIDDTPAKIWFAGADGDETMQVVAEGVREALTLQSDETVTWAIAGGPDAALFDIDATTGAVTFRAVPEFEIPGDADADNDYVLQITATDAAGNLTSRMITVRVADVDDTAPTITGPDGQPVTTVTVNEGTPDVITLSADEDVTWSVSGGEDADHFSIDAESGVLTFTAPMDFESPADGNGDNLYLVEVTATDLNGHGTVLAIGIRIVNVAEIEEKLAEIGDDLASDIRDHAARSLGDMLSFNEDLMIADGDDFCLADPQGDVSGALDANNRQQQGRLAWTKAKVDCERGYRLLFDAGTSISRFEGNWTTRGLGSVRFERRLSADLVGGLGIMGSLSDDELASFDDSSISDRSLQLNAYLKAKLLANLRAGAFASVGRSWYDFSLGEGGLQLAGSATGKRTAFGGSLSGDIPLGALLVTTDIALSHAREDLGNARLAVSYAGEAEDGIAMPLGSVDMTRLSVPVKLQYALWDSEDLDGKSARILLSPGLLCEDYSVTSSALRCGYQLGAKVEARTADQDFLYLDYRYEAVDSVRRNLLGAGVRHRFGASSPLELSLEGNRASTPDGQQEFRGLLGLTVAH